MTAHPIDVVMRRLSVARRGDRELLEQFVTRRDEAAFAALVQRHSGMVQSVCRSVLRHRQDAEDACQATFLVLAKRATSIRNADALSSWLHGVAYRIAAQARKQAARRRVCESEAAASAKQQAVDDLSWREVLAILHAELQRLPEKYRLPLILCCLEGRTRDETARQLGWTFGTLKGMLDRSRDLLRGRLERRGVTLAAALATITLGQDTMAATCAATARAAMAFAAGQATTLATTHALALAEAALKTGSSFKAMLAALLLVGVVATGAAIGYRQSGGEPREQTTKQPADSRKSDDKPLPQEMTLNPERVSLKGSVVNSQGKPIPGATVILSECPVSWSSSAIPGYGKMQPTKTRILGRTATDIEGRFDFKDVAVGEPDAHRPMRFPFDIVVAARGHALAWQHWLEPGAAQPMRFVLLAEKPLRGRVMDKDGRPVKAARLQVVQIARIDQLEPPDSTHADCIYLHHIPVRPSAETDADGSFAITGLPNDVRVTLRVSHERFILREVFAATTDQQPLSVLSDPRSFVHSDKTPQPVLSGEVDIRLELAGRLLGRAIYADTGKPVPRAGVGLTLWPPEYAADEEGRFNIDGLPPGKHTFRIYPPKDSEYLGIPSVIEFAAGKEVVRDFKLRRGVPVKGRVLDEETGKGVAGVRIMYVGETAAQSDSQPLALDVETGPGGRFRMAVPPGKGELFVAGVPPDYVDIDVATGHSITEAGPRFRRTVAVTSGKAVADVEFQLAQGVCIKGRAIDPAGKPANGVTIAIRHHTSPNSYRDLSRSTDANGAFRFGGLREQEYELIAQDRRRRLAARIVARPDKDKPKQLDVKLHPMVRVTGCARDDDGNPVADAIVRLWSWDGKTGTATPYIAYSDAQGLFTLDMLVSGAMYGIQVGARGYCGVYSQKFELKAGDPHTLADLTLKKADQSLAGVLVSKTGKPLAGVIVRGYAAGCESEPRVTDAAGRFRLTGLPRGRIQIDAWLPWVIGGSLTQTAEAGNQNARIELPVDDKP